MKNLRTGPGIVILFLVVLAAPSLVWAGQDGLPESALVVVMSRYFFGEQAGNGFIIGDGTLVVTSDHLVYEQSSKGDHRLDGFVAVFSPYLGQACDARILASDEELDLAVLEVPWKGHPSLAVADANAVMDARSARIVGLPTIVRRLDDWDSGGSTEAFKTEEEELPVAFVAVREHVPQFVTLGGARQVGPGWSGSPLLAPGTSTAVGCFNIIQFSSKNERIASQHAAGPVAWQVYRLLGGSFDRSRLRRVDTSLKHPEDAHEACSLALRASSFLHPDRYAAALESARAFVRLRPESGFGYKLLAYANDKLDQTEAARESYRRAAELDPNSLNGRILHAQFLVEHEDPNGARQILESLWRAGRSRDLVAIALVNLWSEQKEFSRCLQILDEAITANPRDAYLWQQMAGCRMQTQGPAAGVEPLTRAVELLPERGPARASLARLLETTGNLDAAEMHFRKLLDVEPDNPVVYFWLAQFLSQHRTQTMDEALKTAEEAMSLPPRASLPRATIEQLIGDIRSRTEPGTQK
jgi:tetratricopeptide (TPR) repeat protein